MFDRQVLQMILEILRIYGIIMAATVFIAVVYAAIGSTPKEQECPKGMTCYPEGSKYERERNFDFIVIDSIGRRYRPVPCRCDEESHKGCGDLYRTSDCETVDSMSQKITIVYPDGTRKKRLFEIEDFTPPCDWAELRPNFRLERIIQ